ncbi:CaiB/BaiF CoA transferase family protein [Nocardia miyunensis]|uniref:CaiB/BaiF CoA transferase family protein n=1 Tax=Nocardia miyunensis TaxID=282684 RepID=UPI00082A3D9F|nr:CoA transferase [Nocardia miyunensis]
MTMPLQNVKVLDLTTVLAGPLCTMMLGDAGADVIKIEPPGGDPSRRMGPPFWGDQGAEFLALNRNKRSMVLNLKQDEDRRIFLDLCRSADVLVENYRTGVTARLGISYEEIARVNPRIVYCSISGFGRTGPRSEQPAYDAIMQAFVGMMASTGTPGGEPVRANISICDIGAAMYANQAVLLALAARERTGQGQYVEASMFETQIAWLLYRAVGYFATGTAPARKMGSAAPHVVPYEAFPTKDGYVIAGALNDGLFRRMMTAMGLTELGTDPRFDENPRRVANRVELKALLDGRFQEETTEYWVRTLTEGGIPHSPLNSVEDVINDPQTAAREMIVEMDHARLGKIKMPGPAVKLSATPCRAELPPPELGEHQAAIIDRLSDGGAWLAREYLDPVAAVRGSAHE